MAITATIYNFEIDLADHDRSVFESLALRVARHPSESEDYLITRVLAYCLEYGEGIEFSAGGVSSPDDPAIAIRDLTGRVRSWIEIGTPDPERLHRAAKAADRVVVYMHKDPSQYLARLSGAKLHRANDIEMWTVGRPLIEGLAAALARRTSFGVSISERSLLVSIGEKSVEGDVRRHAIAE